MKDIYLALSSLKEHTGYQALQELWMIQLSKIEAGRDKAAARNNETNWRYWAGQEKGFKLATTQLLMALASMEKEDENLSSEDKINELLETLRPKGENQ